MTTPRLTIDQAVIISGYTGILCCAFSALASHPTTVRALATELGMNRDTLADHLRRMRAHGRVYVQHDGHGTIGAVWAARRTT